MASNVPTVRQIAWVSLVPHLAVMGVLIYLFYLLSVEEPFLYGAIMYLIITYGLRTFVAKSHRQGMKLVKKSQFAPAIPFFEKSLLFFEKHSWVDKYRFLTMMSSSRMTYREMALCNIAFCYSQLGDGLKAKQYYAHVLTEFPANGLAIAGLNMLTALERQIRSGK